MKKQLRIFKILRVIGYLALLSCFGYMVYTQYYNRAIGLNIKIVAIIIFLGLFFLNGQILELKHELRENGNNYRS
ncbi:hypothetical protein [Sediminibacter sp. Hel_I_10]|uniref:hypothetical protein n=1 Tax=Sediminibacter sp. Hel_I_10 TaxID=1392490 RepID=UPI000478FBD9|nr:hypothetical protein [Sediminibacter sp. Hel_I_10]